MSTTGRSLALIARLYGISIYTAEIYALGIQRLCKTPPSFAYISKACAELAISASETEIAFRASELCGLTRRNVKLPSDSNRESSIQRDASKLDSKSSSLYTPKQNGKQQGRNAKKENAMHMLSQQSAEADCLRTIAQHGNMSTFDARRLVGRIQRLCVVMPSYSAVAAACTQLAYTLQKEVDIAVRASEIQGLSRQNIKPGAGMPQQRHAPYPTLTRGARGKSVMGQKEIGREYGDNQKKGISDFGDWESD